MRVVLSADAPRDSSEVAELLASDLTSYFWAWIVSGVALLSGGFGIAIWLTEEPRANAADVWPGLLISVIMSLTPLLVRIIDRQRVRQMNELISKGELVRGEVIAHTKIRRMTSSWPVFGVVVRFATRDEFDRQAPLPVFNFDREIPVRAYGPFPAVRLPVGTVIWGFFDPKRKKCVFPALHQVEVSFVNPQHPRARDAASPPR